MSKLIAPLVAAAAAVFAIVAVTTMTSRAAEPSYAEDRAAIEDLQARAVFDGFGHYEDELVKVDGQWLFSKRRIYNENRNEWAFKSSRNPAW